MKRIWVMLLAFSTLPPAWAQLQASKAAVEQGYLTGADGVRLFYRKLGSGSDSVVFLHGGPGLSMQDH